jgi:uncharacterized protein GlcG (DUF336 family)
MFARVVGVVAIWAVAAPLKANAQAPLTERNVSMSMVQAIIAGAVEQCSKDGYRVSVVVVDKAGAVAGALRGDGTSPHTIEFAKMKAYTSRIRGQTSLQFMRHTITPENAGLRQIPGVVAIGGGVPIKIGTETIGGVGVSGAPGGEKDEACALAGLERVRTSLQ